MLRTEIREIIRKANLAKAVLIANREKYDLKTFIDKLRSFENVVMEKTLHVKKMDRHRLRTNIVLLVVVIFALVLTIHLTGFSIGALR